MTNVLFLTLDQVKTTFYTYYAYSNVTCGSPNIIIINYYWHSNPGQDLNSTHSTGFQVNNTLFPRKCNNLYNCPVNVATFQIPPFVILSQLANGTTYFDGIEGIVVRVLSQRLHFTPVLVTPDDNERWGTCGPNMTNCNGCLKLVRTVIYDEYDHLGLICV